MCGKYRILEECVFCEILNGIRRRGIVNDRYRFIGPLYDLAATVYSGGQIDKCKTAMHDHIKPDDKVLFAGVGQGTDAIAAAERGAWVTVVDISQTMLNGFSNRISERNFLHPVRQIHSDIFKFEEYDNFDVVFANFFLNVFSRVVVLSLLEHLTRLAKKNGYVVIGDFATPSGGSVARAIQSMYWYIADIFLNIFAKNALHPIYDYQEMLKGLGLTIDEVKYCRILFDNRYYSILAKRQ